MNDLNRAKEICRSEFHSAKYCNSCDDIVQALAEKERETAKECIESIAASLVEHTAHGSASRWVEATKSPEQLMKAIRERFLK